MIVKPIKTQIFQEGENLFDFVSSYFKKIPEKSVIVVTSKIVALSESRTATVKNLKEKEKFIRQESDFALRTKYVWLTIKNGIVMSSAGIDDSNANWKIIFLPKNSFKTAMYLRAELKRKYKVKDLGVLIVDSRTFPLRRGVLGVALGYAGFKGIKKYKGTKDIFGRRFKFSSVNVADSLATAAVFSMGEGAEKQPIAIITEAVIEFCDKIHHNELKISLEEDMYQPLFQKLFKKRKY